MSVCRGCGAPIAWARTASDRTMPLDAQPDPDGNVEVSVDEHGVWHVVAVHPAPDLFGGERYLPHFVRCPKAEEFRKR